MFGPFNPFSNLIGPVVPCRDLSVVLGSDYTLSPERALLRVQFVAETLVLMRIRVEDFNRTNRDRHATPPLTRKDVKRGPRITSLNKDREKQVRIGRRRNPLKEKMHNPPHYPEVSSGTSGCVRNEKRPMKSNPARSVRHTSRTLPGPQSEDSSIDWERRGVMGRQSGSASQKQLLGLVVHGM